MAYVDVILLEGIDTRTPAPNRARHNLVLALVAFPPYLVVGLTTPYPLASTNTTCYQVLVINDLLRCSLYHLSVLPHHMLGCGDLDLFFRSPRSPSGSPPF